MLSAPQTESARLVAVPNGAGGWRRQRGTSNFYPFWKHDQFICDGNRRDRKLLLTQGPWVSWSLAFGGKRDPSTGDLALAHVQIQQLTTIQKSYISGGNHREKVPSAPVTGDLCLR